jgi:hypothetical protein
VIDDQTQSESRLSARARICIWSSAGRDWANYWKHRDDNDPIVGRALTVTQEFTQ